MGEYKDITKEIGRLEKSIKKLRKKNDELREENKHLSFIFRNVNAFIYINDTDTGPGTWTNNRQNIHGYNQRVFREQSMEWFLNQFHQGDKDFYIKSQDWNTKTKSSAIYRFKHKKGYYQWMFAFGKIIEWKAKGAPKRLLGVAIDSTNFILTNPHILSIVKHMTKNYNSIHLNTLSKTEKTVFFSLIECFKRETICQNLMISSETLKKHIHSIKKKLNLKSSLEFNRFIAGFQNKMMDET